MSLTVALPIIDEVVSCCSLSAISSDDVIAEHDSRDTHVPPLLSIIRNAGLLLRINVGSREYHVLTPINPSLVLVIN